MSISVSATAARAGSLPGSLLLVPVGSDLTLPSSLPAALRRNILAALNRRQFKGGWGTSEQVISVGGTKIPLLAVLGMGDPQRDSAWQMEGLRRAAAKAAQDARAHLAREVVCVLPAHDSAAFVAPAILEGLELNNYRFSDHKKKLAAEQRSRAIRKITYATDAEHLAPVRRALAYTRTVLQGVTFTRDLVNQPASHVSPRNLVERATEISTRSPHMTVRILDRVQARREGFHAFLAVAQGSQQEPYVIHLQYKPKSSQKKVLLVGKGVTFDSGGLSLKPAQYMENMKIDMAGAAIVLGLFSVIDKLHISVEVHGVIAACENMPSGTAYRPGDILTAKNGKTIEVLNTDAEGRITLADALSYAVEQKPDVIIDLATLTGASVVALGDTYAALWSTDEHVRRALMRAAQKAGEGLVSFPLPEEYRPTIESKVADVRNTATMNMGGAITAALFLREFVGNTPWAHVDIAGPVYAERPVLPYYTYGGTGYGVRTLATLLQDWSSADSPAQG